jgi:phosphoglucomutase
VVNPTVDPRGRYAPNHGDPMDCRPNAMASLIRSKDAYDISTGNDARADRHGIVT